MSNNNHDLQANYMIFSLLEKSKMQNEFILENLKGVYAIVSENGSIFKSNQELAHLLNAPLNKMREHSLASLFDKNSWNVFRSHLKNKHQSFELQTDGLEPQSQRNFHWEIYPFGKYRNQDLDLYFILGTDITQLRNVESQLNELFSNIPLGILIINRKGQIEPRYSSYVDWILGTSEVAERPLNSVLFEPSRPYMNEAEHQSVINLFSTLGQDQGYFESIKDRFPRRLKYPSPLQDEPLTLDVSYYPVVKENVIHQILLIIEDKSEMTRIQNEGKKEKELGLVTAKRIEFLKSCSAEILPLAMREINNSYQRLQFLQNDSLFIQDLVQCLHGLKGSSRIAGFDTLARFCHEAEDVVLRQGTNHEGVHKLFTLIKDEWEGMYNLYQALFASESSDNAFIQKENYKKLKREAETLKELLSHKDNLNLEDCQQRVCILNFQLAAIEWNKLDELRPLLEEVARKTLQNQSKKARLEFRCKEVRVSNEDRSQFYEIFLHLINNSLVHGIESVDERAAQGKPEEGKIEIELNQDCFNVYGFFRDDGFGLNLEKIKNKIIEKKFLKEETLRLKTSSEVLQYIFHPGFSTSTDVDTLSGRGVGLSAIKDIIRKWGGHIVVSVDSETKGARFDFHIPLEDCKFR